jgi:hypothetical protein
VGFSGDGGPAITAQIWGPSFIFIDEVGDLFFGDHNNKRLRKVSGLDNAPYFVHAPSYTITACPGEVLLDTALAAVDIDTGQMLRWSLVMPPLHGIAAVADTVAATGGVTYPFGTQYLATAGYTGWDSFRVRVTDGMKSDTTTLHIYTLPAPNAGTISGADTVCLGTTVNFTDTATGGVWSIGGGAASVSSAGVVMGVSPGTGTLSYSVTNICGTAVATRLITVVDCDLGIGALSSKTAWVSPNPNNGTFTLYLPATSTADATITITDVTGRTVNALVTDSGRPFTVSIPNATKGLYFLRTETGMGLGVIKVIVE